MKKIIPIEILVNTISKLKAKKKKIVLCHGVFDLLHIGHIKHFQEAKSYGDVLVVTLTPDKFVNKGPARPVFNDKLRLEAIAALNVVDFVSLNTSPTAVTSIKKIKPNIYCKGPDYQDHNRDISGQIKNEVNAVKKIRGKVVYTNDITFSSSKLLNQYGEIHSDKQKSLINRIKKKYHFSQIN
jgi:rfaE bifunctional protein nucleotidyltransferase chain/domain